MTLLSDALEVARNGWPVFPCDKSKRPAIAKKQGGRGFHDATIDLIIARERFSHPRAVLIGVPTGPPSGFDVLDLDYRNGAEAWELDHLDDLGETRVHQTLNGGRHYLFRHVPGVFNSASKFAQGVDIRGEGGYVIVPPSPGYRVVSDADIAEWPDWLLKLVLARPPSNDDRPKPNGHHEPLSDARLEGLVRSVCGRIGGAAPGQKHFTLRNAAIYMGGILAHAGIPPGNMAERLVRALPSDVLDWDVARKTAEWGLEVGSGRPLELPDRPRSQTNGNGHHAAPIGEEDAIAIAETIQWSGQPDKPAIDVVAGELDLIATKAEAALTGAKLPVFQRGIQLVRPISQEVAASKGRMTVAAGFREITAPAMMDMLAQASVWRRYDGRKQAMVVCDPPERVAQVLLSRAGYWNVPVVAGVVTTPTLRPNGTLLLEPGYDRATRLYHIPDPLLKLPKIPTTPNKWEAREALKCLLELIIEFPFCTDVDRSVALSALITPVARGYMPVAPLHAIRASTAGTGKSYLADLASAIATGRPCPVATLSGRPEESESRLVGLLLAAFPVISIDNVNGELGGDLLCQAVERPMVRVRKLGGSDIFEIESRATFFATGNGIRVRGDMTRRTLLCSLDAGVERPEERSFKRRPVDDVLDDRGRYVAAILTIIRAYICAEKPSSLHPLVSFEEWSELVRGALVWLEQDDPVASMENVRGDDPELSELRELLTAWRDFQMGETTIRDMVETAATEAGAAALRDALMRVAGVKGQIDRRKLGNWIRSREGRIVDGLRIRRGKPDAHSKVETWFVS